jgi:hypothetical protein
MVDKPRYRLRFTVYSLQFTVIILPDILWFVSAFFSVEALIRSELKQIVLVTVF